MERKGVGFSGPEISGPKGMMRVFSFFWENRDIDGQRADLIWSACDLHVS
jgi:hypothetical protein